MTLLQLNSAVGLVCWAEGFKTNGDTVTFKSIPTIKESAAMRFQQRVYFAYKVDIVILTSA